MKPLIISSQSAPCYFISLRLKHFLSTMFSSPLNLCSAFSLTDQDSHAYKTTGTNIVLCISTIIFLDSKWEDKILRTGW
jgi:hypothetical protein